MKKEFENENLMWEKIERQKELREILEDDFAEYDFLIALSEMESFIGLSSERLNKVIEGIENFFESKIRGYYTEFKYDIFSSFSLGLTVLFCLYYESEKLGMKDEMHPLIDEFKKSGIVNIFTAIRNRTQHGAILNGEFQYQFYTHHHVGGEGATAKFNVYDSEWEKVREKCNHVGREFYDNYIQDSNNKILKVFEKYQDEFSILGIKLKATFSQIYSEQMANRENILKEIEDIEIWLNSNGFITLKGE